MSIRYTLFLIISLFTFIISLFAINEFTTTLENRKNFEQARNTSETVALLLDAGKHWAIERGITNVAIQDKDIPEQAVVGKFHERRELGNKSYQKAVLQLKGYKSKNIIKLFHLAQSTHEIAEQYRALVEKNYKLPKDKRNDLLLKNWVSVMSKQIIASQNLRFQLTKEIAHLDSALGQQAYFKHYSWIMSEFAGRERAIIGGILSSGHFITPQKMNILYTYRGHVLTGWDLLNKVLEPSSNLTIINAMNNIRDHFFGTFEKYRKEIYAEGIYEMPYTTNSEEWINKSTAAINTILNIQEASIQETEQYIQHKSELLEQKMLLNIGFLSMCFIGMVVSVFTVIRKISNPLYSIYETLTVLTSPDSDLSKMQIRYLNKKDEIGAIARGLETFKLTLIEQDILKQKEKEAIEKERILEAEKEKNQAEAIIMKEKQIEKERKRSEHINQVIQNFSKEINVFTEQMKLTTAYLQDTSLSLNNISEQTDTGAKLLFSQTQSMSNIINQIQQSTSSLEQSFDKVENSVSHTEKVMTSITDFTQCADEMTAKFNNSSQKVLRAIELINDVSKKINLLSLNASIESARAGEAGKGFTVVTVEVKNLANETVESVEKVNDLIQSMYHVSAEMAVVLQNINQSMSTVKEAASEIEYAIKEQKNSSEEITTSIKHSSQISSSVEETSSELFIEANKGYTVSRDIKSISEELARQSSDLQSFIHKFITEIKAA